MREYVIDTPATAAYLAYLPNNVLIVNDGSMLHNPTQSVVNVDLRTGKSHRGRQKAKLNYPKHHSGFEFYFLYKVEGAPATRYYNYVQGKTMFDSDFSSFYSPQYTYTRMYSGYAGLLRDKEGRRIPVVLPATERDILPSNMAAEVKSSGHTWWSNVPIPRRITAESGYTYTNFLRITHNMDIRTKFKRGKDGHLRVLRRNEKGTSTLCTIRNDRDDPVFTAIPRRGYVADFDVSPDGRLLAIARYADIGDQRLEIHLYSLQDDGSIGVEQIYAIHGIRVAFAPDGLTLATCLINGDGQADRVVVLDMDTA